MEEKVCQRCGRAKKIDSFYKNASLSKGIDNTCKICRNEDNKLWKKENKLINDINPKRKPNSRKRKSLGCSLTGLGKNDWQKLYKFLKSMNYDVNGDIHQQFCLRHNLPYKERPEVNTVRFTPNDFLD